MNRPRRHILGTILGLAGGACLALLGRPLRSAPAKPKYLMHGEFVLLLTPEQWRAVDAGATFAWLDGRANDRMATGCVVEVRRARKDERRHWDQWH